MAHFILHNISSKLLSNNEKAMPCLVYFCSFSLITLIIRNNYKCRIIHHHLPYGWFYPKQNRYDMILKTKLFCCFDLHLHHPHGLLYPHLVFASSHRNQFITTRSKESMARKPILMIAFGKQNAHTFIEIILSP